MSNIRRLVVCASLLACAPLIAHAVELSNWSTSTNTANADKKNAFGENVSGLFYQPAAGNNGAVLWAVKNAPSILYKLTWDNGNYVPVSSNGWSAGKTMTYPNGQGAPDAEGVTMAELNGNAIYIASERDGKHDSTNLFSILRYDLSSNGNTLIATHQWDLTAAFPGTPVNKGPEALAWVPDSYLLAAHFYDDNKKARYNPNDYANHGTGLFFLGMENTGMIHVYALNHSNSSATRIASIASGENTIMDLSFDRDNNILWAHCDNGCNNNDHLLAIDSNSSSPTYGKFIIRKAYKKPASLPNHNFEGIAIAPESECQNGVKRFIWSNDSDDDGHVLWYGNVKCGALF